MPPLTRPLISRAALVIHILASGIGSFALLAYITNVWSSWMWLGVMSGRRFVLLGVVACAVVGPVLHGILLRHPKSSRAVTTDVTLIAIIQTAAIFLVLLFVYRDRPLLLANEKDRFVLVRASELSRLPNKAERLILQTAPRFNDLPLVGTRDPIDGAETVQAVQLSLAGLTAGRRPNWWTLEPRFQEPRTLQYATPIQRLSRPTREISNLGATKSTEFSIKLFTPLSVGNKEDYAILLNEKGSPISLIECQTYCKGESIHEKQ